MILFNYSQSHKNPPNNYKLLNLIKSLTNFLSSKIRNLYLKKIKMNEVKMSP